MAPGTQRYGNQATTVSYPTAPPPERTAQFMDVAVDQAQSNVHTLGNLFERTRQLTDRLLGGEPTPIRADNPNKDAEAPPMTVRLDREQRALAELLDALRHQVERLETL